MRPPCHFPTSTRCANISLLDVFCLSININVWLANCYCLVCDIQRDYSMSCWLVFNRIFRYQTGWWLYVCNQYFLRWHFIFVFHVCQLKKARNWCIHTHRFIHFYACRYIVYEYMYMRRWWKQTKEPIGYTNIHKWSIFYSQTWF